MSIFGRTNLIYFNILNIPFLKQVAAHILADTLFRGFFSPILPTDNYLEKGKTGLPLQIIIVSSVFTELIN